MNGAPKRTGEFRRNSYVALIRDILYDEANIDCQIAHGPSLKGDIVHNYAVNAKARRVLGWSPRWTLVDGVRETARWFLAEQLKIPQSDRRTSNHSESNSVRIAEKDVHVQC